VEVAGVRGAQAAQVASAAKRDEGQPLARVDTWRLRADVGRLPFVAASRVERHWPSTLRVVVTARVPVAAVPRGSGFRLVDTEGVAYVTVKQAPDGVPVVRVPLTDPSRDTLDAALGVLEQMPASLRAHVSQVSASTPDDVRMRLGKASVVWGSAADTALKSQVLADLVRHKAKVYDVSSPHTPVLR
jgi:cell division protein FtsQ